MKRNLLAKISGKIFSGFSILVVLLISSGLEKAYATHAAGADLTYQCLGGNQYLIEVTFYRDCGGIAEPANVPVTYKSTVLNQNLTVTATKIAGTGQEITVPCATSASTCNGGTGTGIRKFVYQATVTLPGAAPDWKFSYHVCCRNCSITTIMNPCATGTEIYVESTLNNVAAPGNSSPTFSNIPIAFVCTGQTFNYNHGVFDVNGDSLSYELIAPKISETADVTFISPASTTSPVSSSSPFTLNAATGQITFTPNQVQIGIMAIRVKEYRNGQQIGSVIRDMEVYTTPCSNNLPTASGINGTGNYIITTCANQQICFNITTADADASQTVTVVSNNGIAGGTYTISPGPRPTVNFCWTPGLSDINTSPHTFTLTVQDNACPNNGIQTFSYSIYVVSPDFNLTSTNVTCNTANNGTASASPVYAGPQTYLWSTGATTSSVSNLAAGTYTVTLTNSNGCTLSKSVTISQPAALTTSTTQTNISCAGLCNGAINLTVTGGTAGYSYVWTGGQTTQNLTGKCVGTYTVTVKDGNNCTATKSVTLTNVSDISASIAGTNVLCRTANTGTAVLTVSGGILPYTYQWSNGATTKDLTGITAGVYTVTITDGNSCTKNVTVTITQPAAVLSGSVSSSNNVSCYGGANGAINLTVSGGTAPYIYNWSTGATTQNISALSAGSYSVTITDANGCTNVVSGIAVTQPGGALTAAAGGITNVNCYANATGSITLSVSGGTTPYSYIWSNAATTQNLNNISAGTYTVTVTDAMGCTGAASSITVTQPASPLGGSASTTSNVSCNSGSNGAVNLSPSGGTVPYLYSWSNGATTQTISGLGAGNYTVTITDSKGCTFSTSASVTQPSASLSGSVSSSSNVSCFGGNNGTVNLSVSGGTSPYTYLWSNGASTQNITGLASGTYTVTVSDSQGCTKALSTTITQPSASLSSSVSSSSNVSCFGGNNGAVNLTVTGGTAPYTYLWSNGATTQNISNLSSGTYTVNVTDSKGCTTSASGITVTQPPAALSSSVSSSSNVSCFGGSNGAINLSVSGGTSPYTYLWNNGATSQNLTNISSGSYTVTITDSKGCTTSASGITVTQPPAALNSSVSSSSNVSCFGGSNGSINLSVTGGTSPYTYLWNNGATTQNITNISSGTYTVSITDSKGCTTSASGITVTQPPAALSSSVSSSSNVSCFGGSNGAINLSVTGGTSPYTYLWNNGATTQNITNISSGTYTVSITDSKGCTTSASGITVTQPPAALNSSVSSSSNVSCFGGSNGAINLSVAGGTSPYTYLWNNGATTQNLTNISSGSYTVTITDSKGCTTSASGITVTQPPAALNSSVSSSSNVSCLGGSNGSINLSVTGGTSPYTYLWNNGATTQNITNISSGTYTVSITDSKGCTTSASGITVTQPPAALNSSVSSSSNVSCFGGSNGSINLSVTGGTSPYTYLWNNGATTQNITNISSGTYTVSITDSKGCTTSASGITVTQPPAALNSSVSSSSNVSCFGGSNATINLTVSGGTSPYTYLWSNSATTQNLNNVAAGSYNVTITDSKGCSTSISAITITQPPSALNANVAGTTNVSCFGGGNGSIMLNVSGGTSPYSYNWSNGSTSQNLTNAPAGTYSVTITDSKGCVFNITGKTITQPAAALSSGISSSVNVNCFGNSTGSITLNVSGGTSPYTFNWSNGATSQNLSNIGSGNYSVTITDSKGCTNSISSIMISQPPSALGGVAATTQNVSCNSGGNGSVNFTPSGGTAPYTYLWSNGATMQNIAGLYSGTYVVTVTDAKGCVFSTTGVVSQPSGALGTSINVSQNVNCFGGNNGSVSLAVSGGTAPYNYIWNNGATTQNLSNLQAGTYSVSVTDVNGCLNNATAIVTQPSAALGGNASSTTNVSCFGGNNGNITLSVNGGTSPYTYQWNNGATTQNLNNLSAGTFTVTVTDLKGCSTSVSGIAVNQPGASLSAGTSSNTNVSCFGGSNGNINLNATGGTTPYSYLWNNGATSQNLNNITAGTYTATVTDANGCTTIVPGITISQPGASLTGNASSTSNVSCFGGNNGDITLNVSGGTTPYSYQWNNGASSQNLSNLTAGTYTATVTDAHGCSTVISGIAISQPAASLSANTSSTANVSCFGGNNGNINLNVNGGTTPYFYLWSNGASSQNLSNLTAGTYTVTVTDAHGCTTVKSGISISQPAASLSGNASSTTNVSCFGGNNGNINLNVNGGTTPYTYQWNTGATTQNPGSLAAGSYTVTITDMHGCSTVVPAIMINQPGASLSGNSSSTTNVNCYGGNNGNINLNVNGGTTPYSYQWNNGATTQNLTNLIAGTYTATITDNNGCTVTVPGIAINQPGAALSGTAATTQNVSCNSGGNGSVSFTVSGGTSPYSFIWSNGSTTQNISGLYSGTYIVTVTDAQGCVFSATGIVSQPAGALGSSINVSQNVNCFGGNNGTINLAVTGGTAPYTFIWSNGATTQVVDSLTAGTYSVTITDNNGCVNSTSAIVGQPGASLSGNASSTTNVSCFGGNNGDINLNVNGGTAPYSYQWNNGATSQNLSNLAAGTYTATVTDVNGCTTEVSGIAINQPGASLNGNASSTTNVSCFGGNNGDITLNVTGGTVPYSYQWNNGATSQNLSNLAAGTYTATITDMNGCTTEVSGIAINQPGASLNGNASSTTNVSCFGGNNGDITLNVTGGTVPYSYQWNNGATSQNLNNLAAGTYTATVTDMNGCTTEISGIAINQPGASLSGNTSSTTNVSCFGGNNGDITLMVSGGTFPYTYQWSNGETSQNINNLAAGTYTATVTDINGCTAEIPAIAINQPGASLSGNASSTTNVSCFGGNNGDITLSVNGGTMPYSYQWSDGETTQNLSNLSAGTYTATVTDANGCTTEIPGIAINQPGASLSGNASSTTNVSCFGGNNGDITLNVNGGTSPYSFQWNNGATSQNLSNLPAGTYTATVTDINGCTTMISGIAINQPGASVNGTPSSVTNASCNGAGNGDVTISVTGGTSPYSYQWNNGATSQGISNLTAGNYTVIVTDINGCSTVVAAVVGQPDSLNATISTIIQIDCFGDKDGDITLAVTGGIPPYSYQWSNGATTQVNAGISAGTYTATITDAHGCTTMISSIVLLQPLSPLTPALSTLQNVSCYSGANGTINLSASGGTSPYTYSWNNGATSQNISNLTAATYTVLITDAHGCTATGTASVTQPATGVAVNGYAVNSNCLNGVPGSISTLVYGGTGPYSYLWSTGGTAQDLNNQGAGTYSVTVTDANGCSTEGSYIVLDNSSFSANASGPTEVCQGEFVTLTSSLVLNANYQWFNNGQPVNGANSNILITPDSGSYTVTVTNSCGSFFSNPINVTVHPSDKITLSDSVVVCPGKSAQLLVTGGSTYLWQPALGLNYTNIPNPVVTPTAAATLYTVTVTNIYGCKTTGEVEVDINCDTLIIPTGFSPNEDGVNDYFVIKGLENYPGNTIWIYNRWGSLIYQQHEYENKWNGVSNVPGIYIGKKVPASTYFYVLDLNNNSRPRQGYIVMKY